MKMAMSIYLLRESGEGLGRDENDTFSMIAYLSYSPSNNPPYDIIYL